MPIGQAGDYLTGIEQRGGAPTIYTRPDVAANFIAMVRGARREGVPITAREGYRDWAAQAAADARLGPGLAASPGASMHGMGTAIDLSNYDHDWLVENARRYGFYQPMDYEPWHWQLLTAESGGYSTDESIPTLYSQPAMELYERLANREATEATGLGRRRRGQLARQGQELGRIR